MGEFDVKFAAYERAMQRDNYWGLKDEAIGEQLGRQSVALQRAEQKAESKKAGREFARQLAEERRNNALAEGLGGKGVSQPADVVNVTQPEAVKSAEKKSIKIAEKISCGGKGKQKAYFLISTDGKVYEVVDKKTYNNASRNKTISLEGLKEVDTTKRKLPQRVQTQLDKITDKLKQKEQLKKEQVPPKQEQVPPKKHTYSNYAQEHGTTYNKPEVSGVVEADRKAEQIIADRYKSKVKDALEKPTRFSPEILDNYSGHGPNPQLDAMNEDYRVWEQQGKQKPNKHNKFIFNTTINVHNTDNKVLTNIEQNINETNTHIKDLKSNLNILETKINSNQTKINANFTAIHGDLGKLADIAHNQGQQLSHLTELVEKQGTQLEQMSKKMGKMNKKMALVAGGAALVGGVLGSLIGGSKKETTIVKKVEHSKANPFIPWIHPQDTVKADTTVVPKDTTVVKPTQADSVVVPQDSVVVKPTQADSTDVKPGNKKPTGEQPKVNSNPKAGVKSTPSEKPQNPQKNIVAGDVPVPPAIQTPDSVGTTVPVDTATVDTAKVVKPAAPNDSTVVKESVTEPDTLFIKKYGKRALKRLQKKFEKYPERFKEVPVNSPDYKIYIEECRLVAHEEMETRYVA